LRVGLVDRHGHLGAAPDETLTPLHERVVDGRRIEAFGREELEAAVLALQVDRADFRDHEAGDLAYDLVEPALAVARLLDDLAQATQDDPQPRLGGRPVIILERCLRHFGPAIPSPRRTRSGRIASCGNPARSRVAGPSVFRDDVSRPKNK